MAIFDRQFFEDVSGWLTMAPYPFGNLDFGFRIAYALTRNQ
jgi:hypothetical protein